jgi:hypothetical protein
MSLDGYIAGSQGEADWIVQDPTVNIAEFFKAFYAQFEIAVRRRACVSSRPERQR